jgi:hypothetical protein
MKDIYVQYTKTMAHKDTKQKQKNSIYTYFMSHYCVLYWSI